MKSKLFNRFAVILGLCSASALTQAHADTYTWDIAPGTVGVGDSAITGGTGTWNTTNGNWTTDGGATNIAWLAAGIDNDAVFGGTAGTVTLGTAITANDLTFNTTGYTVTGSTLTLNGTTPTITTATGVTATISSGLAGSAGMVKNGAGTLTLSGSTSYTGPITLNSGVLRLAGASGMASTTTINTGSTLRTNNAGNTAYGANFKLVFNGGTHEHAQNAYATYAGLVTVSANSVINASNVGATTQMYIDGGITGAGNLTLNNTGDATNTGVVFRNLASNGLFAGTLTVNGGIVGYGTSSTALNNAHLDLVGARLAMTNANGVSISATNQVIGTLSGDAASTVVSNTQLTVGGRNESATFAGVYSGSGSFVKTGSGTQILSGANTYTGATTVSGGTLTLSGSPTGNSAMFVNGGTLNLDYAANNTSKISDTAALTLSGGTLNLSGGSHTEVAASTTLGGGTSSITRSSGSGVLRMNAITRNNGAAIDFAADNIADTDTLNTNGILGAWATVGGTDFAMNSTNAADGLITAYSGYTDVTRLDSGSQVIADSAATNVRLIEGTGSAANLTLGAPTTTINTLNQSASGGSGAATIDPAGQILATNGILVGAGAGGLTVGTGVNNGTLRTAAAGGSLILNNQSSTGLTVNSVIANNTSASALNTVGGGTITLTGTNTYTGVTTLGGGTLSVATIGDGGVAGNLGAATNAAANLVLAGGTLQYTGTTASTNRNFTLATGTTSTIEVANAATTLTMSGASTATTGALTKTGAGTLVFVVAPAATNAHTGGTNVDQGTLSLNLTARSNNVGFSIGTITVGASGTLELNNTTAASYGACNLLTTGTVLTGTGTITKTGAGIVDLWTNTDINAFAGLVHIQQGTLAVNQGGGATSWSSSAGNMDVSIDSGAIFDLRTGGGAIINQLTGSGTVGGSFSGSQLLTVGAAGGSSTFNGVIQNAVNGGSGSILLTKTGGGTLTLTGANAYTGATTISGGVLNIRHNTALGTIAGGATVASGAALQIQNNISVGAEALTLNGTGVSNDGALRNISGANSYAGAVTLAGGSTRINSDAGSLSLGGNIGGAAQNLTVGGAGNTTFAGAVNTATGTLTKDGAGALTMAGTSTYTGATNVNDGTLVVDGSISTSVLTTVASGATIAGSGTTGALTVQGGGFINPGNSPGILTVDGNYTQAGTYNAEINGLTAGDDHDQINVTGTVDITGGSLNAMFGSFTAVNGDLIFILLNGSGNDIGGIYSGLAQGDTVATDVNGFDWIISYTANYTGGINTFTGGNDIALMAVIPEPSSALLGSLGMLALLRRRRPN